MSGYIVELEVFVGPVDLLLNLVRRTAIEITQVALGQVTAQFLGYLGRVEVVDPVAVAAFCEDASTLLLLKSRALLPRPPAAEPDEDAGAEALAERLRAYRQFKHVANGLQAREHAGLRTFTRVAPPPELPVQARPGELSAADLAAAFELALAEAARQAPHLPPPGPPLPAPRRVRLADRLVEIRHMLAARGRVTFHEILIGGRPEREYIVVSFLAVLELLRRAAVRAVQPDLFGEILIELRPGVVAAGDNGALLANAATEGSFLDD